MSFRHAQDVKTEADARGLRRPLLAYTHWWSDEMARAQLSRDVWSAAAASRQTYGELTGMIVAVRPQVQWATTAVAELLSNLLMYDTRAGAALSAANVWSDTRHRKAATTGGADSPR